MADEGQAAGDGVAGGGADGRVGGSSDWRAALDPGSRTTIVRTRIIPILEQVTMAREGLSQSQAIADLAAMFEDKIYRESNSKEEYLRKISARLIQMGQQPLRTAAGRVAVTHGSNAPQSSTPTSTMAALASGSGHPELPGTSGSSRQPYQLQTLPETTQVLSYSNLLPKQNAAYSLASPHIQQSVGQEQSTAGMPNQILSSQPVFGQHPQSVATRHLTRYPATARQLLLSPSVPQQQVPANYANYSLPGALLQQNHLFRQNGFGFSIQQQPHQRILGMNQQPLDPNHPPMGQQTNVTGSLYLGGHPAMQSFQQNARPTMTTVSPSQLKAYEQKDFKQPIVLESQPATLQGSSRRQEIRQVPQASGIVQGAGEADWKEEIFQQIKTMKEAFLLELVEFDQTYVPGMPKEGQAMSVEQTEAHKARVKKNKDAIRTGVAFLQLQKSQISERLRQRFPMYHDLVLNLVRQHRNRKATFVQLHADRSSQDRREQPHVVNATGGGRQPAGASDQQKLLQPKEEETPLMTQQSAHHPQLPTQQHPSVKVQPQLQQLQRDAQMRQSFVARTTAQPQPQPQQNNCSYLLGVTGPHFPSVPAKSGAVQGSSSCTSVKSSTPSDGCESLSAFLVQDNGAAGSSQAAATVAPGTSAWLLPVESTADQCEDKTRGEDETPAAEKKPVDSLVEAILTSSPTALCSSAKAIESVITSEDCWSDYMVDSMVPQNRDLKALCSSASAGSCMTNDCDASELESNGEEGDLKRRKLLNANAGLLEEIRAINDTLIDTVISISDDTGASSGGRCGTLIQFSYSAVSLGPSLRSLLAPPEVALVMPTKLLVPSDYPRSYPVPVEDEKDEQLRKSFSHISDVVNVMFGNVLRRRPELMSIEEMARAWDGCVRKAITDFACRHGGGTFTSRYGKWESCVGA